MNTIEAVIFDWAGTTVDYGCFAPVQAFVECFSAVGITPTIDEVRAPMGMLKRDHIKTMLAMPRIHECFVTAHGRDWTEQDVDGMYQAFEGHLLSILKNFCAPKPHLHETVSALRARGVKLGSTTGYTDKMMAIVVPTAASLGYAPDCWFSADAVGGRGRPYPYMLFRCLEQLGVSAVRAAVKVGDTVSDILEGVNAGVWTIGVIEGSSELALTEEEFNALSPDEQNTRCKAVAATFHAHGAHLTIRHLGELPQAIAQIERGAV